MKKNEYKDEVLDYLLKIYTEIFNDKNLVDRFELNITPEEFKLKLNENNVKEVRKNSTKDNKHKSIRDEIKKIDNEEELEKYFEKELKAYFDNSISKEESKKILRKCSKEELLHLYRKISDVSLPNSKSKEDILWLIKKHFDNKSRIESMLQ